MILSPGLPGSVVQDRIRANRRGWPGREDGGLGSHFLRLHMLLRHSLIAFTSLGAPKPSIAIKSKGQRLSPLILQKEKKVFLQPMSFSQQIRIEQILMAPELLPGEELWRSSWR